MRASSSGEPNAKLKLYYGAHKWGAVEWIGKIYPHGTKERDFLSHYVQHYNSIELNATHYKPYTSEEIKKWAEKAEGRDFLFCPKFPQSISHLSSFNNVEDLTNSFLESISTFKKHLGPVFLQVSDRFSPKRKESLYYYLQLLPRNIQFFLEVRNPDWFEERTYEEHLKTLRDLGIGSVINDSPDRILNRGLSLPKCFIRYTPTGDLSEVQKWFDQVEEWGKTGLGEAYFFVQPGIIKGQQLEALQYFKQLVVT